MIDASFLYLPAQESWGYTNVNDQNIVSAFTDIQQRVNPINVVEIGMFAGHSTILMLSLFNNLKKITSYDPGEVSLKSSTEISSRHPQFSFNNTAIWGHEDRHLNETVDLVYVDGDHRTPAVLKDIVSTFHILPRFVLFDNVEHAGVSAALRHTKLYDVKYNPTFYFYTNTFKQQHKPGIFMLLDLQNISEADILFVLQKASNE